MGEAAMGRRWQGAGARELEAARRLYARAVVEHERVRRAGARGVQPSAPLWRPLHDLAFFHGVRCARHLKRTEAFSIWSVMGGSVKVIGIEGVGWGGANGAWGLLPR